MIGDVAIVLVVLILALAVLARADRRWAVRTAAFGFIGAALALILDPARARRSRSSTASSPPTRSASLHTRVWWIATEQPRLVITSILAIGVVGLLGAFLARGRRRCYGRARRDGAVPARAGRRLRRADCDGAAPAAWSPTPAARNWLTVVLLIALAVLGLEALRRQTAREFPDAQRGQLSLSMPWNRGSGEPGPPAAAGDDQTLSQLSQLGTLRADGVLSDEEFARKKTRVLDGPATAPVSGDVRLRACTRFRRRPITRLG